MNVREQQMDLPGEGVEPVPCSIWSITDQPGGVVLLGHGLGVDRFDATVRRPVEVLTREYGAAVVVPEIPLHGVRDPMPDDPAGIVDRWQAFWAAGGATVIRGEFERLIDYCDEAFGSMPLAYFGLSLGTQYGIPFLAQTTRIRSAVLGLFGSDEPPRTPVMNRYAPAVRCPVYFVQKLDDEIHPADSTAHLFETLGANTKVLDASSGAHAEVTMASVRNACAFLAHHGGFGGG